MHAVAPTFTAAPSIPTAASRPETVLSNRVTIYSLLDSSDVAKLANIVNKFLKI